MTLTRVRDKRKKRDFFLTRWQRSLNQAYRATEGGSLTNERSVHETEPLISICVVRLCTIAIQQKAVAIERKETDNRDCEVRDFQGIVEG